MTWPTEPKKLSIHSRVVEVLGRISDDGSFFYTPGQVQGKETHWKEKLSDYQLSAYFAGAEEAPIHYPGTVVRETFTIVVQGWIRSPDDELQNAISRALRDVRKALFDDMGEGSADCLGAFTLLLQLGPWQSSPGEGSMEGFGYFRQEFKFSISGDISSL